MRRQDSRLALRINSKSTSGAIYQIVSQFTNVNVMLVNSIKIQIQMECQTIQPLIPSTPTSIRPSLSPRSPPSDIPLLQNSILQNLISLQKAPFLVQQPQSNNRKINSPDTTYEHPQHKVIQYNRKEKSLEELSKKFLKRFQGKNKRYVELDKVTIDLRVEKRRIYDIINILESLKVVEKNGKNSYKWKGLTEAVDTIAECQKDKDSIQIQSAWKEKSLEYLASGLLKLFLHWKPILSLEEAAKEIIRDLEGDKLRTKIRRLYDIINVFKSLKLVQKITLPNRKNGFKWLGTRFLEEYIQYSSEGIQSDEESFSNFRLEDEKMEDSQTIQKATPNRSFLFEIFERKVGAQNVNKMSNMLQNLIWPLEKSDLDDRKTENAQPKAAKKVAFPIILTNKLS